VADPAAELFKAGMRRLAAGVCIITTADGTGMRSGLTATAVCSLSAQPPLLLACLNRSSRSYAAVAASGCFAVNVLAADAAGIAQRFASSSSGESKFEGGEWRAATTGAPVLATALAAFDCRLERVVEAGTHAILIGEVAGVSLRPDGEPPLLYADGTFGGFAPAA